jgi:hypothetical protein
LSSKRSSSSSAGQELVERRVLPGHADLRPHAVRVPQHVDSGDGGAPAVGSRQRGEDANGRRLARAVRAEHAEDLALGDVEVEPCEGVRIAK